MTANSSPVAGTGSGTDEFVIARKFIFRAYVFSIFTMVFCVNDPAPLFELFRRSAGLSPSQLSMLYTVYAAVVIVALPFFGRASDRFGRRSVVVLGLSFIAVGSTFLAAMGGFSWLVSGRFLQGLGIAAMSAPSVAALAEIAGTKAQGVAASTAALALAVGGASAPLFSGIAAEVFPAFPTWSLLVCTGLALASLVTVALLPDPWRLDQGPVALNAKLPGTTDPSETVLVRKASGRGSFWLACTAVVACFGAQATFFTICGPIFSTLMASHVLLAAGCAMSALMLASCLGATLARRLRARRAIAIGMVFLAPGVCGFFELAGAAPAWALIPAITAIGLGHGLGYAGAIRFINETADAAHRAIYTSKFYVAVYIGGGLPVLGRGALEELTGQALASAVFSFVIAVLAVGLLIALRLTEPPKSRQTVND